MVSSAAVLNKSASEDGHLGDSVGSAWHNKGDVGLGGVIAGEGLEVTVRNHVGAVRRGIHDCEVSQRAVGVTPGGWDLLQELLEGKTKVASAAGR